MKSIFTTTAAWLLATTMYAQNPEFNVCVYDFCSEESVQDITVKLKPDLGMEAWLFTGANGCATFNTAAVPTGSLMQLSLIASPDPLTGITTSDILRFQKHLSGEQPFTEAYQWLAADVNRDHVVDPTDLALLQNIALGNYAMLPNSSARLFFPVDFVFTHPELPILDTLPELPVAVVNGQVANAGFYAVLIGDVDRSGCATSDVHEQSGNITAQIFPNPVSDILHVHTPDNLTNKKITLTDPLGKVLLTTSGTEIPVAQLPNGMYLLKIMSGDRQVFTSRVQVVH